MDISNNLSFLFVTEAIKELRNKYDGMNDRDLHIETHIFNLGRKPGFAFAGFLCMDDVVISNDAEAAKFLANVVAFKLFGIKGRPENKEGEISISFKTIPPQLKVLTSADGLFSSEQLFWYRCFSNFIAGVFAGALAHFGYKVVALVDPPNVAELKITFKIEKLEGAWTFYIVNQH